jgi:predicted transcriptional regulator
MVNKELRKLNKKLQNVIGKKRFADRIEELIKEGMIEIVDCEEDGTPIVNITDKGRNVFLNELGDA